MIFGKIETVEGKIRKKMTFTNVIVITIKETLGARINNAHVFVNLLVLTRGIS